MKQILTRYGFVLFLSIIISSAILTGMGSLSAESFGVITTAVISIYKSKQDDTE